MKNTFSWMRVTLCRMQDQIVAQPVILLSVRSYIYLLSCAHSSFNEPPANSNTVLIIACMSLFVIVRFDGFRSDKPYHFAMEPIFRENRINENIMIMYEAWWIRYFRRGRRLSDFYSSFCGIPLAGAVLPVIAFFMPGMYGKRHCKDAAAAI